MTPLVARRAATADADLLRAWRNDEETRRWSRSAEPVAVDQHAAWLTSTLADPARQLWVVERDGIPVATVRHDQIRPGRYEVSVTVAPDVRGQGVAGEALADAQRQLLAVDPHARVLEAHVRTDNAASLRLFERAGYRRTGTYADGLAVLELPLEPNAP